MRPRPSAILLLTFAALLGAASLVSAASLVVRAASFAGQWRLDLQASQGLPPFYAAMREHTLDIAHDDTALVVAVALVDTAGAITRMRFPYDLRRPVATATAIRTPAGMRDIPTVLTAVPHPDRLEVDIAREIRMGERLVRPRDHETWRLSPDGRALLIDREAEMPGPGGMQTYRMHYVFVRR